MLVEVRVPVLAESVAEATLMNWHKKPGDTIRRGDSLIDIETDKVTLEVAAPNNGVLVEVLKGDGEDVASNEVIARIETKSEAVTAKTAKPEDKPQQQSLPVGDTPAEEPKLSPAVRKLLEEHNLDPASIPVSGADNRLTKEDILRFLGKSSPQKPLQLDAVPASTAEPKPRQTPKTGGGNEARAGSRTRRPENSCCRCSTGPGTGCRNPAFARGGRRRKQR